MPFFRFFHSSFHIDPNNRDNHTVYLMGADEKCQAPPGPIFEYRIPIAIVFLDPTNRKNDVAWRWRACASSSNWLPSTTMNHSGILPRIASLDPIEHNTQRTIDKRPSLLLCPGLLTHNHHAPAADSTHGARQLHPRIYEY